MSHAPEYTHGQEQCITTLDRSIVVSAGAGSGKTFTLTKRIAHAFEEGYVTDIDQVLAITFTRKAAGELKSRLKAELRAIGRIDQALKVDDAWVSTIHSMCSRMLRAHALEMGIDPAFKDLENADAEEFLRRAIDEVLREVQADDSSPELDSLFANFNARGENNSIEKMVKNLVDLASTCPDGFESLVAPDASGQLIALFDRAVSIVEDLVPLAEQEKDSGKRNTWLALAKSVLDAATSLRGKIAAGAFDEAPEKDLALAMLEALGPMKFSRDFGTDIKKVMPDAQQAYLECTQAIKLMAARGDMLALVQVARDALQRYSDIKKATGFLDNNDRITLAARMMEEHPDIAALYADKFKLVMVDEFQDTDQMQVDMIKRLAGPGACRLCTVGDAQQSIYRFRGADVLVYQRHLDAVHEDDPDAVILLPDNFRSHADVLKFVDCVFAQPDMFGGSFMSLTHKRDEEDVKHPLAGGPRIEVQVTTHPSQKGASTDDARLVAARRIAARFAQLASQGQSLGDMVVLLGSMKKSEIYAQAMRDAGLPCVISGGSVFSQSAEVALVKALLRVIANPYETQALYEVLASPLFALTAGDFVRLVTAGGVEDGLPSGPYRSRSMDAGVVFLARGLRDGAIVGVSPQLACAVRAIERLWTTASRRTVSRLLEQVVVESGLLGRLESRGAEGLASAGNLYKALRIVGELEQSAPLGPLQLVRTFEATMETSKEAPGALSATGGEFVRIMTVHSSKGLEFPIVAVAEMRSGASSTGALLARRIDGRLHVSLDLGKSGENKGPSVNLKSDAKQPFLAGLLDEGLDEEGLLAVAGGGCDALTHRAALAQAECLGDVEEAKRLLYVALTRAKEALIVSMVGTMSSKAGSSYKPNGVLGGIVSGLDTSGAGFGCGVTLCEFGGEKPAVVDVAYLAAREDCEAWRAPQKAGQSDDGIDSFAVAAPLEDASVSRVGYRPAREGVFSYSSVADAAHEGDLLPKLAEAFCQAVDEAAEDAPVLGAPSSSSAHDQVFWGNRAAAVLDEDDGSWAYAGERAADDDKATDLGTAFHRLAQYAVVTRPAAGTLAMPPVKHIDALARACKLGDEQRARLQQALDRWFASDVAAEMDAFADLRAEVPFLVALDDGAGELAYLDGEIDLLGLDATGTCASVVDYKTGGHADETPDQLAEKHVLQASCYALALLRQGLGEVQATFVRVEQPRAGHPDWPQCVRYRFTAADLPTLEAAVAEAYRRRA